ncbi:unnamed protein product [Gordionus sp. m RMFG-2023]
MLHWHVMIVCLFIIPFSVKNYARVALEVNTIRTANSEPPRDDVRSVYIGPTTLGDLPCQGTKYMDC